MSNSKKLKEIFAEMDEERNRSNRVYDTARLIYAQLVANDELRPRHAMASRAFIDARKFEDAADERLNREFE